MNEAEKEAALLAVRLTAGLGGFFNGVEIEDMQKMQKRIHRATVQGMPQRIQQRISAKIEAEKRCSGQDRLYLRHFQRGDEQARTSEMAETEPRKSQGHAGK